MNITAQALDLDMENKDEGYRSLENKQRSSSAHSKNAKKYKFYIVIFMLFLCVIAEGLNLLEHNNQDNELVKMLRVSKLLNKNISSLVHIDEANNMLL